MSPELPLLKAFLAAADTLSFTRAAEQLGVSQPRLSLLIRKLEEQLGFRVFTRAHRRVELTRQGEMLREKAQLVMAALREMDDLVWELKREGRARLRIGSPRYMLEIPERLRFIEDFNFQRPSVKLEVESDRTPPLLQRLYSGDLDLIFATVPFDENGLDTLPFALSEVFLAIPQEDACAHLERVPLTAVEGRTVATYPGFIGRGYYRSWFGPLAEAGAKLVEAHDDHPAALLKFAARRRLWTVVHQWSGQRIPLDEEDRMAVRPLESGEDLRIAIRLAKRSGSSAPALDAFWAAAEARLQSGEDRVT